jgi:plastocyanin
VPLPRLNRLFLDQPPADHLPSLPPLALALGLLAMLPMSSTTPASASRARAVTGRIEGEVVISSALSSRRPRFRIYADPGPGSRPPAPETNEIRNVVLYVQNAPDVDAAPTAHATMRQDDERFMPHVLPIVRGTTVDFPNADDVFHNVFSLSSTHTFDLGRYPKGSAKAVTFEKSGIVQVFCHIHSDMSAVILVLDGPHFAQPATDGRYVIDDVPPGEYTVVGWHERIKPVMRKVRVVAGETTRLDFNIPLPSGGENFSR